MHSYRLSKRRVTPLHKWHILVESKLCVIWGEVVVVMYLDDLPHPNMMIGRTACRCEHRRRLLLGIVQTPCPISMIRRATCRCEHRRRLHSHMLPNWYYLIHFAFVQQVHNSLSSLHSSLCSVLTSNINMKLYHSILLMTMITQASPAPTSSTHSHLKGWFACSDHTSTAVVGSAVQKAECAYLKAPLCYPGLCEAPEHVDSTVKIFVKRIPAVRNPKTASNFWLLQGDSGGVSASCKTHNDLLNIAPAFY